MQWNPHIVIKQLLLNDRQVIEINLLTNMMEITDISKHFVDSAVATGCGGEGGGTAPPIIFGIFFFIETNGLQSGSHQKNLLLFPSMIAFQE